MLTELGGKSGGLCEPAKRGELHCPLIVRPSSEDVVTGNIFGVLKSIDPRWWLADLMNQSLGSKRFRQQVYRQLNIELWQKQPSFPRHLLPWEEGQTEVDVEITWENPRSTIFVEMKYGSPISLRTQNNNGNGKYPGDQLIRNARVGLYKCGWYGEPERLFDIPQRDFVLLLLSPRPCNTLVQKYRDAEQLLESIPHANRIAKLPRLPLIGEATYKTLVEVLQRNLRFMSRAEKIQAELLCKYLEYKLQTLRRT